MLSTLRPKSHHVHQRKIEYKRSNRRTKGCSESPKRKMENVRNCCIDPLNGLFERHEPINLLDMPNEVLFNILRFITVPELMTMSEVSKKLLELSRDKFLWTTHFKDENIIVDGRFPNGFICYMLKWRMEHYRPISYSERMYSNRWPRIYYNIEKKNYGHYKTLMECSGQIYIGTALKNNPFGCIYVKNCAKGLWTVVLCKSERDECAYIKAYLNSEKKNILDDGWELQETKLGMKNLKPEQRAPVGIFNCTCNVEAKEYCTHSKDGHYAYIKARQLYIEDNYYNWFAQYSDCGHVIAVGFEVYDGLLTKPNKTSKSRKWNMYHGVVRSYFDEPVDNMD